jgi:hypothetical protein
VMRCECRKVPEKPTYFDEHIRFKNILVNSLLGLLKAESSILMWTKIVNKYSTNQLTFTSDRLVALAGIAKHLGSYLAGTWETHLLSQLSWSCFRADVRRPETYRVQSWSWASVEGCSITFHFPPGNDNLFYPVSHSSTRGVLVHKNHGV